MSTPTLHNFKRNEPLSDPNFKKPTAKENPNTIQKPRFFTRSNSTTTKVTTSSSPLDITRVNISGNKVCDNVKKIVRSVSNGRPSVCGNEKNLHAFSESEKNLKIGRYLNVFSESDKNLKIRRDFESAKDLKFGRDLNVFSENEKNLKVGREKFENLHVGLRGRVSLEKNGEVFKNGSGFGENNRGFRDLSVKSGEKVNILEKNGSVFDMNHEKSRVSRDSSVKRGKKGNVLAKSAEFCKNEEKNRVLRDSSLKYREKVDVLEKSNLGSKGMGKSLEKNGSLKISGVKLGENSDSGSKGSNDLPLRGIKERKSLDSGGKSGNSVNVSGRSVNKYPSKLHEKLAFLEGKVKRIASDINKTKEMLDMNNPDLSKVILSDIQDKISGIEKAMGNVTETKEIISGNKGDNVMEKVERNEVENVKSFVNGLNSEELEARLFPHHKLLRDRTSVKVSALSSEKLDFEVKVEEKLSSHVNENPVEVEFLASLGNNQNKVTVRGENVQETDDSVVSKSEENLALVGKEGNSINLTSEEALENIDEQEIRAEMIIEGDIEDTSMYQFNEIGHKTTTAGWFVADGEAALLAHDDGSCSYYDIANSEVKSAYRPPIGIPMNVWRDCWIVRAPGADGSSGRYVVAASAGNSLESGFCSWDFYAKDILAFHMENGTSNSSRTALAPLPSHAPYQRNSFSSIIACENHQWWYRPSGPLITSTASNQKSVTIYDIRDGEQIMKWETQKPVLSMDYSSPLQWRNRGKVVIAESESISLWDVNSLVPQALQSIATTGRRVYAFHVNNSDAELGGGVRQRASSVEAEGNDGVFCTTDSINVLDFRQPSGIGFKISKIGVNAQSVFSRGDSIFLGCTKSAGKNQQCPQIQQFSLRKQKLFNTYCFPDSDAHPHYTAITQVWGNSNLVMGVNGLGLFVFDGLKDDGVRSLSTEYCSMQKVKETVGPDDLYSPTFDYSSSRLLLISRDRPALLKYLP